jgi:hypothetical protein
MDDRNARKLLRQPKVTSAVAIITRCHVPPVPARLLGLAPHLHVR